MFIQQRAEKSHFGGFFLYLFYDILFSMRYYLPFLILFLSSFPAFAVEQSDFSRLLLEKEQKLQQNQILLRENTDLKATRDKLEKKKNIFLATTMISLGTAGFTGYKAYESKKALSTQYQTTHQSLTSIMNKIEALKDNLTPIIDPEDKAELEALKNKVNELVGEINVLSSELQQSKIDIANNTVLIQNNTNQIAQNKAEIDINNLLIQTLTEKIAETENSILALQNDLALLKNLVIQNTADIAQINIKIQSIYKELDALTNYAKSLEQLILTLEQRVSILESGGA